MDFNSESIKSYKKFSYRTVYPQIEKYMESFESINFDLKKAGMKVSLPEYISMAIMTSIIVFIIEFPFMLIITLFIPNFSIIMGILFSFSLSIVFSISIFFFFYIYPSMTANGRKRKIDFALPFATLYLATASGSNAPPKTMFKILSKFEEYGELNKEAREITKNIDIIGMSTLEAIKKAADKSPSEEFKELLWGIDTTISTGGNLSRYLHGKARTYIEQYKRMMKDYSKKVSTLLEIYVTLIVVGSIFFIVISSMMSAFGSGMIDMIVIVQFFVIFFGLPVISIAFIIVLKYLSPNM